MWAPIDESWEALNNENNYFWNFLASMPNKLNKVLVANGAMAKYEFIVLKGTYQQLQSKKLKWCIKIYKHDLI